MNNNYWCEHHRGQVNTTKSSLSKSRKLFSAHMFCIKLDHYGKINWMLLSPAELYISFLKYSSTCFFVFTLYHDAENCLWNKRLIREYDWKKTDNDLLRIFNGHVVNKIQFIVLCWHTHSILALKNKFKL